MRIPRLIPAVCAVLATGFVAAAGAAEVAHDRGDYLFRAAGCGGCHTDEKNHGPALAGGPAIKTPRGTFYGPNITPEPALGLGRWREADFIRAMREGVSPEGAHYYPSFPYASYTRLTDDDLRALWAYLRRQPPVAQPNRPHDVPWYLRPRSLLGTWKALYFTPGAWQPRPDKDETWNRGAYLVEAVTHCGECHTPRDALGGPRRALHLAGTRDGPDDSVVPNITPDRKTGIGRWRKSEIVEYLATGMTPEGDFAGERMAEIIDRSTSRLTPDDREAIATYLLSLPPVEHATRKEKQKPVGGRDEFGF
ncbi:MAG: cytochrome C [Candidatus Muproteobacteria bacterium RBG_16_64_10]|uniref:Cytochrome C n=1 Tax=Candidatus Muproteobacteria bacterium RBG_16_64_10 TaxID=1817757 RepID=A0A1F6SY29_9PROT|nr:MAG: cytochrome C [Candidatus Muproteobacteria bacterium RBG_16_64_10]